MYNDDPWYHNPIIWLLGIIVVAVLLSSIGSHYRGDESGYDSDIQCASSVCP